MITIISGGQTGVDRVALEIAKQLGFPTGGVAPKNFRTETGPDPSLRDFGLTEHASHEYPPRTRANVEQSDATIWFGNTKSPGYRCTMQAVLENRKPYLVNPNVAELLYFIDHYKVQVLNIAGNRGSKHPEASDQARAVLMPVLLHLGW